MIITLLLSSNPVPYSKLGITLEIDKEAEDSLTQYALIASP